MQGYITLITPGYGAIVVSLICTGIGEAINKVEMLAKIWGLNYPLKPWSLH